MPMPAVTTFVSGRCLIKPSSVESTPVEENVMPSRYLTCPIAISTAEPEMKPLMTG
jgi:hypothetical protein